MVFGNANGAGEENRNVARMATLLAGLPVSIPGTTVNRLCGSSLDAAIIASRQINTGDAELMLVGGAESMSRAPWVLPKTEKPYPAGDMTLASTTLGWRLVNKAMRHGLDRLPGRGHRAAPREVRHHPGGAGRILRPTRTTSPPLPGTRASTTASSPRSRARTWSATRASAPDPPRRSSPA